MHQEHPAFAKPPEAARLWRYMTLPKLLTLLQTESLFFTRLDSLGDRFEGTLPERNVSLRRTSGRSLEDQQIIRTNTLVNCWHLSRHESDALWQIYGRNDAPVAIRTTGKRLSQCFSRSEHPVYIGMVYYTNYQFGGISPAYEKFSFLFKRDSFQHEREVRAVIRTSTPPAAGRYVKVDIATLIDQVYVPSTAPDWLMDTIAQLLAKYGHPRPIKRSRQIPHDYL